MKFLTHFVCLSILVKFITIDWVYGDFNKPERLAFPPLCQKHFLDKNNITNNTWLETCDKNSFNEVKNLLNLIPKPYEADCFECSCGGLRLNRYNAIEFPVNEAFDEIDKLHQKVKNRHLESCVRKQGFDHCEAYCWDGGYFRRMNHKYFHFFKHFLTYCNDNPSCDCYWHETSEKAVEINDQIYKLFEELAKKNLINSEFSTYWLSKRINFDRSGRSFGESYSPTAHGIASSLTTYTFFYSQYRQVLLDIATYLDHNAIFGNEPSAALDSIYDTLDDLRKEFIKLYNNCLKTHLHPKILYERGMLRMHTGKPELALNDIKTLIQLSHQESFKNQKILTSEIYHQEGNAYADLGMYDQAIASLNQAIALDAKNKQAYFRRAEAYFETGNFNQALEDFLASELKRNKFQKSKKISVEFQKAFLTSLVEGAHDSAKEFIPTLAQSAYGFSQVLWVKLNLLIQPKEFLDDFVTSSYNVGLHIAKIYKTFKWDEIEEECITEFKEFCERYNDLKESERGRLLGYLIGKYGVDIFAGGVLLKEIELVRNLKEANRLCNLEAQALTKANKEAFAARTIVHNLERQKYFKNVKIHWDKQNKHIPGKHNYEPGKSILEHLDPQTLLQKFAGSGRPMNNQIPGSSNYKELVDFGEHIGIWKNKENSKLLPTTKGVIHYSKAGAHIIPAHPDSLGVR